MIGRRHRATSVAVLVLLVCVVAGCSTSSDDAATTSVDTGEPTTTTAGSGTPQVALQDLQLGVDSPIDLTTRPDSTSLLVAERGGRIVEAVADGDGFRVADEPVIDLSEQVGSTDSERGLLGIAVSRDGRELYASYTEAENGDSRIDAYQLSGTDGSLRADTSTRRELVAIPQPFSNHNGGALRVGPDGMLYAGFGDGGAAGDPEGRAQDPGTQLGKILRLDPAGVNDADGDGFPDDNPTLDGGAPGIWATGLRNPWRISFDAETGDLWIGDVGQNRIEEINLLEASEGAGRGANLGWDLFEGDQPFDEANPAPGTASSGPFVEPVHVYEHTPGCSVTGGYVYRGSRVPDLVGTYVFGDFCDPRLRGLQPAGEGGFRAVDLGPEVSGLASIGQGPDRELYTVGLDGTVSRIVPA